MLERLLVELHHRLLLRSLRRILELRALVLRWYDVGERADEGEGEGGARAGRFRSTERARGRRSCKPGIVVAVVKVSAGK